MEFQTVRWENPQQTKTQTLSQKQIGKTQNLIFYEFVQIKRA